MSTAITVPHSVTTNAPLYRQWTLPSRDRAEVDALARAVGVPTIIAELLLARGIDSPANAKRFLSPALEDLHDTYSMRGMQDAVTRVQAAIRSGEPILIYGDYDVDGTTAIVLLTTAIELLGGSVRFHIPHRLRDGYGMQAEVLTRAASDGVRLVISVDTGIRAFAAAEEARRLGLDLIVTDHHLPEAAQGLPEALAILNPNQPECGYACKHLCGAGVAFKLSQALLEAADPVRARSKLLPSFLKMLVIATVADAVPLLGENRIIASLGVEQLRHPVNPGLRALMEIAKLDGAVRRLTATDLAFRLAPRINAAGRMDVASDVVELFTTRDTDRARVLAEKLDRLNTERRDAEAAVLRQIDQRLDSQDVAPECVVIDGEGWHRGVIGILASRVVERTNRPALVIAHENGEAHGSGRSIPGFHLLGALESCHDLFTRFGGHAHAVGFSLPSDRIEQLRTGLRAHTALTLTPAVLERKLRCDAALPLDEITPAFFRVLRQLEPYGMGNEEPVFIATGVRLSAPPTVIKQRHVRLRLSHGPGRVAFSALGWRWAERIAKLQLTENSLIDLAYRLRENEHPEFGGLELEIVDLRRCSIQ